MTQPDHDTQVAYFQYLDQLQERGETNMYGAAPYLRRRYPELSKSEAMQVVRDWISTYKERHPHD